MRTIVTAINILLLAACIYAGNPPSVVQKAFEQKFPKAANVSWGKENPTEYESDFILDGVKYSAKFDASGKWLETEKEIEISQLPQAVSKTVKMQFAGFKIKEAESVETLDQGNIYEVEVEKGEETYDVQLTPTGDVLKKTAEQDDKD